MRFRTTWLPVLVATPLLAGYLLLRWWDAQLPGRSTHLTGLSLWEAVKQDWWILVLALVVVLGWDWWKAWREARSTRPPSEGNDA